MSIEEKQNPIDGVSHLPNLTSSSLGEAVPVFGDSLEDKAAERAFVGSLEGHELCMHADNVLP